MTDGPGFSAALLLAATSKKKGHAFQRVLSFYILQVMHQAHKRSLTGLPGRRRVCAVQAFLPQAKTLAEAEFISAEHFKFPRLP